VGRDPDGVRQPTTPPFHGGGGRDRHPAAASRLTLVTGRCTLRQKVLGTTKATTGSASRAYRNGPFAMYALSEYVGSDRVNHALRRLIARHDSAGAPLATTLDLYRELQAVTPDTLRSLLHDLFEVNTFWTFDTKQGTAEQTGAGTWRVTLDVEARKVVVDSAGVETPLPMDEWVEIGIFAAAQEGEILGKPLYVQKHRIRSGRQTITVTLPHKPDRAGIDPYNLLDWETGDNIEGVKIEGGSPKGPS
jgi:ABC-2 type transport system permease protein